MSTLLVAILGLVVAGILFVLVSNWIQGRAERDPVQVLFDREGEGPTAEVVEARVVPLAGGDIRREPTLARDTAPVAPAWPAPEPVADDLGILPDLPDERARHAPIPRAPRASRPTVGIEPDVLEDVWGGVASARLDTPAPARRTDAHRSASRPVARPAGWLPRLEDGDGWDDSATSTGAALGRTAAPVGATGPRPGGIAVEPVMPRAAMPVRSAAVRTAPQPAGAVAIAEGGASDGWPDTRPLEVDESSLERALEDLSAPVAPPPRTVASPVGLAATARAASAGSAAQEGSALRAALPIEGFGAPAAHPAPERTESPAAARRVMQAGIQRPAEARMAPPDAAAASTPSAPPVQVDAVREPAGPDATGEAAPARREASAAADLPAEPESEVSIEHVVELVPGQPINGDRLVAMMSSLRHIGSKPVRIDIRRDTGPWMRLQSGGMVHRVRCSVLLADRQGALNPVEISDFDSAMASYARQLQASFSPCDMASVLERARQLDALASRLDTQIRILVEVGTHCDETVLARIARQLNMVMRNSRYWRVNERGMPLFSMATSPNPDRIEFVLDVPRSPEDGRPWATMIETATQCAKRLAGRVIKPDGQGLSVGKIEQVGAQLDERYRELADVGLPAGSQAALRLFN